jgi:hypothetical protein
VDNSPYRPAVTAPNRCYRLGRPVQHCADQTAVPQPPTATPPSSEAGARFQERGWQIPEESVRNNCLAHDELGRIICRCPALSMCLTEET